MGGDDSQKLLPWRGSYSPPGRKPPAHYRIDTVAQRGLLQRGDHVTLTCRAWSLDRTGGING